MPGYDDQTNQRAKRRPSAIRPAAAGAAAEAGGGAAGEPVTLVKGGHKWTFRCDPGDEPELLRRVTELARSEDVPFDWFDAALVTHQLSKRLKAGLYRIDGNSNGTVA